MFLFKSEGASHASILPEAAKWPTCKFQTLPISPAAFNSLAGDVLLPDEFIIQDSKKKFVRPIVFKNALDCLCIVMTDGKLQMGFSLKEMDFIQKDTLNCILDFSPKKSIKLFIRASDTKQLEKLDRFIKDITLLIKSADQGRYKFIIETLDITETPVLSIEALKKKIARQVQIKTIPETPLPLDENLEPLVIHQIIKSLDNGYDYPKLKKLNEKEVLSIKEYCVSTDGTKFYKKIAHAYGVYFEQPIVSHFAIDTNKKGTACLPLGNTMLTDDEHMRNLRFFEAAKDRSMIPLSLATEGDIPLNFQSTLLTMAIHNAQQLNISYAAIAKVAMNSFFYRSFLFDRIQKEYHKEHNTSAQLFAKNKSLIILLLHQNNKIISPDKIAKNKKLIKELIDNQKHLNGIIKKPFKSDEFLTLDKQQSHWAFTTFLMKLLSVFRTPKAKLKLSSEAPDAIIDLLKEMIKNDPGFKRQIHFKHKPPIKALPAENSLQAALNIETLPPILLDDESTISSSYVTIPEYGSCILHKGSMFNFTIKPGGLVAIFNDGINSFVLNSNDSKKLKSIFFGLLKKLKTKVNVFLFLNSKEKDKKALFNVFFKNLFDFMENTPTLLQRYEMIGYYNHSKILDGRFIFNVKKKTLIPAINYRMNYKIFEYYLKKTIEFNSAKPYFDTAYTMAKNGTPDDEISLYLLNNVFEHTHEIKKIKALFGILLDKELTLLSSKFEHQRNLFFHKPGSQKTESKNKLENMETEMSRLQALKRSKNLGQCHIKKIQLAYERLKIQFESFCKAFLNSLNTELADHFKQVPTEDFSARIPKTGK